MDAPLPKGTIVRQVVPVIEGTISDITFNANLLAFQYQVDYVDEAGNRHSRWFSASEVAPKQNEEA